MVSVDGRGESSHIDGRSVKTERMKEGKNEMEGHRMMSAGKKYYE
jgi:hypothetical protein